MPSRVPTRRDATSSSRGVKWDYPEYLDNRGTVGCTRGKINYATPARQTSGTFVAFPWKNRGMSEVITAGATGDSVTWRWSKDDNLSRYLREKSLEYNDYNVIPFY